MIIILLLEGATLIYLILAQRMVIGHDGFELLANQWFYINSAITTHAFPLWSPYINHGIPMWLCFYRMDIFSNVMMLLSPWIKNSNFLPFYYGGLFFDKFILLCGVWLLARRYFSNRITVFFVAVTVMATTITYTQNSFPLCLPLIIPLLIYFLHRFFDSSQWKWLFLAFFLFCTESIHVVYFIPIITLALFIYFFTAAALSRCSMFRNLKMGLQDIPWMAGIILIIGVLVFINISGHDPWLNINTILRNADGTVPLKVFLTYGQNTSLWKWWELFLGTSLRWDFTLYMGLLTVPLCMAGIFFSQDRRKYIFIASAVFFLLFSCATPLTQWCYELWPSMKFYRHIAYVAPLIKLYLCFLAGFGFERLFCKDSANDKGVFIIGLLASLILLLNAAFLFQLAHHSSWIHFFLYHLSIDIQQRVSTASIGQYLSCLSGFSLIGALVFFLRPLINYDKYSRSYLIIFFLLHLTSLYWYAYDEIQLRTFELSTKEYHLLDFQKMAYVPRRAQEGVSVNSREEIVNKLQGKKTDAFNNFTFDDMAKSTDISDFSLKPYYAFASAFENEAPSGVFNKLAGVSEDKIQFFSQAYPIASEENLRRQMEDKKYDGNILFYLAQGADPGDLKGLDLSENQRLKVPYRVLDFTPNQILVSAEVPQKGVWMQYSDTWHPFWKANVNGQPRILYNSSLAYKAIELKKGKNIIRLYVASNTIEYLYSFFMISSLVWVVLLIWLMVNGCQEDKNYV